MTSHSASPATPVTIGPVPDPGCAAVPLSVFLARTAAVLRAGWPETLLCEATVIKVSKNAGGYAMELVDPGPRGAAAGQLRAFLPAAALPGMQEELGFTFDPEHLVGLDAILRIAPAFDPKWHLQARITGLGRAMQASLAARRLEAAETRLRREGLSERQRRLPRPADVTRLAVVHPPGSAGLADVAREIAAWTAADLIRSRFVSAPFEGPHAAERLGKALQEAVAPIAGYAPDLVLLLRGGGARSGLLVLDDEALARTVATLPVPVITGLGHATDRSLVDAVAHAACDTPSKALGLVRDLMREPARRALAGLADIRHGALVRLATAANDDASLHRRVLSGAERLVGATEASCASCWAIVRVQAGASRAVIDTLAVAVDRHRDGIIAGLPLVAAHVATDADRLLRHVSELARSGMERLPDAGAVAAEIRTRATTFLVVAERELGRSIDAVVTAVARILDQQDALLQQAELGLGDLDHSRVLGRGYALVRDAAGRVLTTRAAAEGAGSLFIEFGDGVLAVVTASSHSAGSGAPA